ncbi:MAG TPA: ATP-binding protein [Terrimicrobiaceae bacterium]|nr:ATP-binding protein [Terrimicrobiaceae bacterium]
MKTLGARLALLYSLVSTLTLFVLLATGYYLLSRHLVHGLDLLNAAEFERVKPRLWAMVALPAEEADAPPSRISSQETLSFMMEIERPNRGVEYRSANLGGRDLPKNDTAQAYQTTIPGLGEWRVGRFFAGGFEVRMATSMTPVQKVMDGYAQVSLVLICLILLASLVSGLILSNVALKPVRLIRETANRIRSDNLSERIPVSDVQDEISGLARLLNEMFDRLESSFQQVRRFSAEASHELKTPLSLVRLQAEKLLNDGNLTGEQEEAVLVQLEEISHLNLIIEELLLLSRAEAGAIGIEFRTEDPTAFLESLAADAQMLADHAGVRFEKSLEGSEAVRFDRKWMRQVLLNVVTNALKYSPKGGLLTLESEFTLDSWRLAVEDEGPGVPTDQQERIFERFVRIDPESTAPAGSGLGLAICRSIIELHGGAIRAETGPRKGGLRVAAEIPLSPSLDRSRREVTPLPETEEIPPQGANPKPDGEVDH